MMCQRNQQIAGAVEFLAARVLQWWQQQDADLEAVPLEGVVELSGDTTLP